MKNEKLIFINKYIIEFKKENKKSIEENKARYQKEWQKIEKDFYIILAEIIQINWPQNKKIIEAMISVNPICPRFLDDWSFSIFYNYKKIPQAMEVIMHESCHFLYFKKWKELFPKSKSRQFESPSIVWHLSELIAPIILNDYRIQKILKHKAAFYKEHSSVRIGKVTAPAYFTKMYKKCIKKKNGFEIFLNQAYKEIKKHKKLFN